MRTQSDPGQYKHDGTYSLRTSVHFPLPESYAFWVSKKLKAAQNAPLWGIEEIFPQDFGLSDTVIQSKGEKRQNRRWRILKASELVPEKKGG